LLHQPPSGFIVLAGEGDSVIISEGKEAVIRKAVKQPENFGYKVTVDVA